MSRARPIVFVIILFLFSGGLMGLALDTLNLSASELGTLSRLSGQVSLRHQSTLTFQSASVGQSVLAGSTLRTGANSEATIQLQSGEEMVIAENSEIYFDNSTLASGAESVVLDVASGGIQLASRSSEKVDSTVQRRFREWGGASRRLAIRSGRRKIASGDLGGNSPVSLGVAVSEVGVEVKGSAGSLEIDEGALENYGDADPLARLGLGDGLAARSTNREEEFVPTDTITMVSDDLEAERERQAQRRAAQKLARQKALRAAPQARVKEKFLTTAALTSFENLNLAFTGSLPQDLAWQKKRSSSVSRLRQSRAGKGGEWLAQVPRKWAVPGGSGRRKVVLEGSRGGQKHEFEASFLDISELSLPFAIRLRKDPNRSGLPGLLRMTNVRSGPGAVELLVQDRKALRGLSGFLDSYNEVQILGNVKSLSGKRHIFSHRAQPLLEIKGARLSKQQLAHLQKKSGASASYEGNKRPIPLKDLQWEDFARLRASPSDTIVLECEGKLETMSKDIFVSMESAGSLISKRCDGLYPLSP